MNNKTELKFRQINKNEEIDQTKQEHKDLRGSAIFVYIHRSNSKIHYVKYGEYKL